MPATTNDLLKAIHVKDALAASAAFTELMSTRCEAALQAKKQEIAAGLLATETTPASEEPDDANS